MTELKNGLRAGDISVVGYLRLDVAVGAQRPALEPLVAGSLNLKLIQQQFLEILRLVASIKQGTVTASLILRKASDHILCKRSLCARPASWGASSGNLSYLGMAPKSGATPTGPGWP